MASGDGQTSRQGEVLAGKYHLLRLLGAGGMGEVYQAENRVIGRTVAIKVLRPELARVPDLVARFLQEARAANLVRHAHVVDVLDFGQDEKGVPFIVQEFLEGEDFATYLERAGGRLPLHLALDILLPVIDAVALAHSKGVVHRDLKPENVFLAQVDGRVVPKLLDFGISQVKVQPGERRLTVAGSAMGTPEYMSPEQVVGSESVDIRTDVWAMGVILFQTVSGRLPFDAANPAALMVKVATEEPLKLAAVVAGVLPEVDRIVGRCLRRDASSRYPTAAELARDLRNLVAGRSADSTQERVALRASAADLLVAPFALSPEVLHAASPTLPEPSAANAAQTAVDLDRPTLEGAPPTQRDVPSLPELDLDPDEKRGLGVAGPVGQVAPKAPAPPPKPVVDSASSLPSLDLAVPSASPASLAARLHVPRPPPKDPFTWKHAVVAGVLVVGATGGIRSSLGATEVAQYLRHGLVRYSELAAWWLRGGLALSAILFAVTFLITVIRRRPFRVGLLVAALGLWAFAWFEGNAANLLQDVAMPSASLELPRWLILAMAAVPLGLGLHGALRVGAAYRVHPGLGGLVGAMAVLGLTLGLELASQEAVPVRAFGDAPSTASSAVAVPAPPPGPRRATFPHLTPMATASGKR